MYCPAQRTSSYSATLVALILSVSMVASQESSHGENSPVQEEPTRFGGVGFVTPESVLYDSVGDVYMVSNINGKPIEKDGNGFISRITPDGMVDLKWIDGSSEGVVLHATKGTAIVGDSLFVADIDHVRIFHRVTGEPLGSIPVPGTTFLNDVATTPRKTLLITDSMYKSGGETHSVYEILPDHTVRPLGDREDSKAGNGLLGTEDGFFMSAWGKNVLYHYNADMTVLLDSSEVPGGGVDGVVMLEDGTILVSSWREKSVFMRDTLGNWTTVVSDMQSPADIGFDFKRNLLLIPLFQLNEVVLLPLNK